MTKLPYLILLILLLTSCSKDISKEEINPFVGIWKPIMITKPFTSDTIFLSTCEQRTRYQFNEDGEIGEWSVFSLNDSNECFKEIELISGSWIRNASFNDNTFFELSLINTSKDSTYQSYIGYDASYFEDYDYMLWRTNYNTIHDYLHLVRVD